MINQLEQYKDMGYFIEKNFFSMDEIDALSEQTLNIFDQWKSAKTDLIDQHKLVNMSGLTQSRYFSNSKSRVNFFDSVFSTKLWGMMSGIFGDEIRFHNTQLFFDPLDLDQLAYWHRDLQFSDIPASVQENALPQMLNLHCRIPLIAETGIVLVPGTHSRWDTKIEHEQRSKPLSEEPLPTEDYITLNPGDLLIFNAQMIHRGHYSKTRGRRALDLCIGRPHPLLEGTLDTRDLPTPEEKLMLTNPQWYP